MQAALGPLQTHPRSGGKFHSPSRAIPCPKSLPLQARLGLLFSFSAFLLPARPLVCVDGAGFLSSRFAAVLDSLTTGSHNSNGAGNPSCWCRFLTWPPKSHTGPHRGEFGFSLQNELTPPPKGGGAGFCSSLGFRVLLGSCLWQPLATTGSHGSNRAGLLLPWCRFPTWPSKPHTGAYRGEFGFHRLFLVRFFCGSPANCRSRW